MSPHAFLTQIIEDGEEIYNEDGHRCWQRAHDLAELVPELIELVEDFYVVSQYEDRSDLNLRAEPILARVRALEEAEKGSET